MKKKASDKEIAYITADHQANLMRLAAAWAAVLRDDTDSTNAELIGNLANLLEDYQIADYSREAQKQYLQMNAKILQIRAKGFAAAADYMARQCEKLAENEVKWANAISKQMNATGMKKNIRVSGASTRIRFLRSATNQFSQMCPASSGPRWTSGRQSPRT